MTMPNPILTAGRKGLGGLIAIADRLTRPKPQLRTAEAQQQVNTKAADLALYHFPLCPFCIKVRRHLHQLNVPLSLRDASRGGDAEHRSALERDGGKIQVPCLRIKQPDGSSQWLYESGDVIDWLDREFS